MAVPIVVVRPCPVYLSLALRIVINPVPATPSARDVVVTPLRGPNATCNWQCSRPCRLHHGTCIWWFCLLAATCSFGGFAYWPLPAERADVLHRIVRGRVGSAHALPTARYVAVGHVAYSVDLRDPDAYPVTPCAWPGRVSRDACSGQRVALVSTHHSRRLLGRLATLPPPVPE